MTNIYTEFKRAISKRDIFIGKVLEILAQTSRVQDLAGHEFRAIGTDVEAGKLAIVENGVITGEAPEVTDLGDVSI